MNGSGGGEHSRRRKWPVTKPRAGGSRAEGLMGAHCGQGSETDGEQQGGETGQFTEFYGRVKDFGFYTKSNEKPLKPFKK